MDALSGFRLSKVVEVVHVGIRAVVVQVAERAAATKLRHRSRVDDHVVLLGKNTVGSRVREGGSVGEGLSGVRNWGSRLANAAARILLGVRLGDPMSGFFLMRRQTFEGVLRNLSQQGFKILLDLFASAPRPLRFAEVPYQFRPRTYGESKLDTMVAWE